MLTGDNGILTQAQTAKEETEIAEEEEKRKLLEQEAYMIKYNSVDTEITAEENVLKDEEGNAVLEDDGVTEKKIWECDSTGKITAYNGNETEVHVPTKIENVTVTGFNQFVFKESKTITKMVIPGTLKELGTNSISQCENLEEVILKEGITKINTYAFMNCNNLKYLVLPSTLEEISTYGLALSGIRNIVIPETVTTLGDGIFGWCINPITIHCEAEESTEKEDMPAGDKYNWSDKWLSYAPEGTTVVWGYNG